MRKPLLLIAALATSALAMPVAAHAETRYLDTYERRADGYAGPVRMNAVRANTAYVLSIKGTFSSYPAVQWRRRAFYCGRSEPRPQFRSPGRRNGMVGADAMFVFAERTRLCRNGRPRYPEWNGMQLSIGGRFTELTAPLLAAGETTVAVRRSHTYEFPITTTRRVRPRIRLRDPNTTDNYGRLRLRIRRAVPADCANGNFTRFGYVAEAECVAGLTSAPAPVPVTPAA